MNVGQLKQILENLPDDIEVQVAYQPNYPFALSLSDSYCFDDEYNDDIVEDDDPDGEYNEELVVAYRDPSNDNADHANAKILYLSESQQSGYLPGKIAELLGWT